MLRARINRLLPLLLPAILAGALPAQDLPPSPDYSQEPVRAAAEKMSAAWAKWRDADKPLEGRIFALPMTEARRMLEASLARFLDVLEARRGYTEAVMAYMDKRRLQPSSKQPAVTAESAYRDQVDLIGVNLEAIRTRLSLLKDSPHWVAIRRGVSTETSAAMKLQGARREEIPLELTSTRAPSTLSGIVFNDSERVLAEALQRLWTLYYQNLMDEVERPRKAAPLVPAKPGATETASAASPTTGPGTASAPENPLIGNWSYTEGSQQFNGVGEPHAVMLELWMENGALAGRYRAELPDFDGVRKVDVLLKGIPSLKAGEQILTFDGKDAVKENSIVLEGPGPSGMDLMLLRSVTGAAPVPRGRELLRRR